MTHRETETPFADLVVELGTIIGGVPGVVIKLAGRILRGRERRDWRVVERIRQEHQKSWNSAFHGVLH